MAISHSSSNTSVRQIQLSSFDDWWGTLELDLPERSSIIKEYGELDRSAVAASDNQDFADELGAVLAWFRVLTPPERAHFLCRLLAIHSTPRKSQFFALVLLKSRGLQRHGQIITEPNHPAVVLVEAISAIDEREFSEEVPVIEGWFKPHSNAEQVFIITTLLDAIDEVIINFFLDLLVEMSAGTDHSNGMAD
jgi:hypothetical protein